MAIDPRRLQDEASRLKTEGQLEQALALNRRAVLAAPRSGVAEHNLASTLGDLTLFGEAEAATARALAKGLDAPETWLVRARALQGLKRLDEAETAYAHAIARRPAFVDAQRDLAQLRWMRTGDVAAALATLEATMPPAPERALLKARILTSAGSPAAAAAAIAHGLDAAPGNAALHEAAARAAGERGDPARQIDHATTALRLAPASATAARALVEALLHAGRANEAEELVLRILVGAPQDQGLLALLATAWRLRGDPRHAALCEHPALVSFRPIVTPSGWADRNAFLAELAATLHGLHGWRSHPLEQSLRHGSQTQINLARSDLPVLRALFAALDAPIRAHIAGLGAGSDPLRVRRRGDGYRILGAWSVLLQPGGYHIDHVHPEGWISSAFYVELPAAVARGREGWLAFGRPGVPTAPAPPPFTHIRPAPGHVALFPSYLWHGTEPFAGDAPRLTVAFDLVPA